MNQPVTTTQEVREVREVRVPETTVQEVRRVESVGQPVQVSQVQRVDERVENYEMIEEIDRPHYHKRYDAPVGRYHHEKAEYIEKPSKEKCCGTPCWALLGLLGLAGVVLIRGKTGRANFAECKAVRQRISADRPGHGYPCQR